MFFLFGQKKAKITALASRLHKKITRSSQASKNIQNISYAAKYALELKMGVQMFVSIAATIISFAPHFRFDVNQRIGCHCRRF